MDTQIDQSRKHRKALAAIIVAVILLIGTVLAVTLWRHLRRIVQLPLPTW
jgi:sensor histidine kinase regulating citrate/malate metabolism